MNQGDLLITQTHGETYIIELLSDLDPAGWAHIVFRESSDADGMWVVDAEFESFMITDGAYKFSELRQHYVEQISQRFDFEKIAKECLSNLSLDSDSDEPVGLCFLGSVFSLTPSGKYYMPWACSNVTPYEAKKDEIWNEAMTEVFEAHNFYLQGGEGDPCDIFAQRSFTWEEVATHRSLDIEGKDEDEIEALVRKCLSS